MMAKKKPAVGGSTSAGGVVCEVKSTTSVSACQGVGLECAGASGRGSRRLESRVPAAVPDSQYRHGVFGAVRGVTPPTNRGVVTNV